MSNSYTAIETAIKLGDKLAARKLLKPLLQNEPTAEVWYLAAQAMESEEQAIKCLRQALKIDEFHTQSNRLLHKIEGSMPLHEQQRYAEMELRKHQTEGIRPLEKIERQKKQDRFQKHAARQKSLTRYGCLFSFLLSMSCSMFAFSAIGLLPGFIGTISSLFGGPAPVYEIEGTAIEAREDAPLVMTPSQSKSAGNQEMDIMDNGYLHEYVFKTFAGKSYAIYVQFLSLNANQVSRNVVIIDAYGNDVTNECEKERILEGDNGVAYVCFARNAGEWRVRILGRTGESIGAYFVGVQSLED